MRTGLRGDLSLRLASDAIGRGRRIAVWSLESGLGLGDGAVDEAAGRRGGVATRGHGSGLRRCARIGDRAGVAGRSMGPPAVMAPAHRRCATAGLARSSGWAAARNRRGRNEIIGSAVMAGRGRPASRDHTAAGPAPGRVGCRAWTPMALLPAAVLVHAPRSALPPVLPGAAPSAPTRDERSWRARATGSTSPKRRGARAARCSARSGRPDRRRRCPRSGRRSDPARRCPARC